MSTNIISHLKLLSNCILSRNIRYFSRSSLRNGIWEPDFVNQAPDIPEYPSINISMKAYDYVTLESFARYVHRISEKLGFDVDAYAVPPRTTNINAFKTHSVSVIDSYQLAKYERIVQLLNPPSTKISILADVLQCNLPEGVDMCLKEVNQEDEEFRYVPNIMLQDLFQQVSELEKSKEDRKRK